MGYSKSPVSVIRIQAELEPLSRGQPCRWHRPLGDVDNWAFKVRQALRIAERYPQQFPGLARHAQYFSIEIVDDTTVQARYTAAPATRSQAGDPPADPSSPTPVHVPEAHGAPRTIVGVRTLTDIITHWLRTQPSNDPLHFPQAELDLEELARLYTWASTRPVPWGIVKSGAAITLMPAGRGTDIEFWTPNA